MRNLHAMPAAADSGFPIPLTGDQTPGHILQAGGDIATLRGIHWTPAGATDPGKTGTGKLFKAGRP